MNFPAPSRLSLTAALLCAAFSAVAQSNTLPAAPLPAAPLAAVPGPASAQTTKPNFALPPAATLPPKNAGAPVPASDQMCYAPAEGIYGPRKADSAEHEQALRRYTGLVMQQIDSFWYRHQPRAVNDPWVKGKEVVIRFAIFPNGTYDPPIITVFSGRDDFDKHALDSVDSFTSYPPLPEGVTRPQPFCMHFRYNLDRDSSGAKPVDLWPAKPSAKQ